MFIGTKIQKLLDFGTPFANKLINQTNKNKQFNTFIQNEKINFINDALSISRHGNSTELF